jgi:hypothetical protein
MSTTWLDYVPSAVRRTVYRQTRPDSDDVLKGAAAGAIGGLVGTLAMALTQQIWNRATTSIESHRHREPSDEDRNRPKNSGIGEGEYPQSEPRSHHQHLSPSERLVATVYREVIHRPASPRVRKIGGSAIHFGFGAAAGAVYGAAAEVEPEVTIGAGTAFGTAVFLAADEVALPLTGLAESPRQTPLRRHAYAFVSHLAYGLATEMTRRVLRDDQ